ncbi:DUF6503 family protein [Algibacter mikhailovii]|uniref:DUF6503 family protein n=1 Tax=Algibacter mikhailovii TaxID=425498 RepID=UPI001677739F|nr:DUF6503 family protein [Algibacter mikhailovii]
MRNTACVSLVLLLVFNCSKSRHQDVQTIVNKSIEISGGNQIDTATMAFTFRNKIYKAKRQKNRFRLERISVKGKDTILDVLDNKGFQRIVNKENVSVPDSMVPRYSASVNSVHYFSVLPYHLNDRAVNKELLGEYSIKGKPYFKIKVTFNQDGGGEDFDDVFLYWVNTETYKVDYLAYSYRESDGLGLRFREAHNERYIKGIRFVDYYNYEPLIKDVKLNDLDELFQKAQLKKISEINLQQITVN